MTAVMLALAFASTAHAQGTTGVVIVPAMDAETYRPAIDSPRLSWTEPGDGPNLGPWFSVGAHYTRDPLVYVTHDIASPVLRNLAMADLAGGFGFGPVRVGLVAPITARATGWGGGETGLGDVALVTKVTALDTAHFDLAVDGRLWLPTTTTAAPVGDRRVSGEASTIVSSDFGPVLLALNVGYRAVPWAILEGVRIDDAVTERLGVAVGPDLVGGTIEGASQLVLSERSWASTPIDLLVGGYLDPKGPLGFKMGVGRGLTGAIGSPTLRATMAMTYTTPARSGPSDLDRDGITDEVDACPRDPEDDDDFEPTDGCPERPIVIVHLVDENGAMLTGLRASMVGQKYEQPFTESARVEVDPGAYTIVAHGDGYTDAMTALTVVDGPPRTVELVLHTTRVTVTQERFDLRGEIYFETASDVILPDSWPLLDEVAQALVNAPQIRRLRIEGHTDARGTSADNLALSQRRAAAVRQFLIDRGIEAGRLISVGYGEDRPVINEDSEAAYAQNRRVEFIVEWWQPTETVTP